jgi:hypothetical protein
LNDPRQIHPKILLPVTAFHPGRNYNVERESNQHVHTQLSFSRFGAPVPAAVKLKRLFAWGMLSGLAATLLAVALLLTLDLGFLRKLVEHQASLATGRALSIDGSLSIRLGRTIRVEARGVRLANADWVEDSDMLHLERVYIALDAASLWQDAPPTILQLELEGLEASLVEDANGRVNWVLGQDAAIQDGPGMTSLPFLLLDARVERARIEWRHPDLARPMQLNVSQFRQNLDEDGHIETSLAGTVNDIPLALDGVVGPWDRLLSGDELNIRGQGRLGQGSFSIEGRFDNIWTPAQPEIRLLANAPSLKTLTERLGLPQLGDGIIDIDLITRPTAGKVLVEANIDVGPLHVGLSADMPTIMGFEHASLETEAAGPDFGSLARWAGFPGWPEQPFTLEARLRQPDKGLRIDALRLELADSTLALDGDVPNFPHLAGAEASLRLAGRDLGVFSGAVGVDALPRGPFSVNGKVQTDGSGQTLLDLEFEAPAGAGQLRGTISGPNAFDLALSMQGSDARAAGALIGLKQLPGKPWRLEMASSQSEPSRYQLSRFDLDLQGLRLRASGHLGTESLDRGTALDVALEGDRLADFQSHAPASLRLPDAGFGLAGRVSATVGGWQLTGIDAHVGTTRYALSGLLGGSPDLEGTRFAFEAGGTDIGRLFELPGAARLPDGPFTARADLAIAARRLEISAFSIQAGSFRFAMDASLPWPVAFSPGRFSITSSGENITRILPELGAMNLDAAHFSLDAAGEWDEQRIAFDRAMLHLGEGSLGVTGNIDLPPNVAATDLTVTAHSPDLSRLGTIDDTRWGTLPLDFEAQLTGNAERFELSRLRARLGETDVLGLFSLDVAPDTPEFNLRLTTEVLDLRPFLNELGANGGGTAPPDDGRLIPDTPLNVDWLTRANGTFSILTNRLLLRRSTLVNNVVSGEVRDGRLAINELGTDTHGGRLAATLTLQQEADQSVAVSTGIHSRGLILDFSNTIADNIAEQPPIDIDIDLVGRGRNVRELAGSLNGNFILSSTGGQVLVRGNQGTEGRLIAQVITSISPIAAMQTKIEVDCLAAVGQVRAGMVELDPGIALQTGRLRMMVRGNLDLKTEKLDIGLRSRTLSIADISAGEIISPYVKLAGTLASPSITLDPKGTLISGGAAFLSGGLSILAKKALDKLEGDEQCAKFLEAAEQ